MDIYELIHHRRSIRKYKTNPVPREVLERIMEAATWAPSGKNLQNWRFFVLQGEARDRALEVTQHAWSNIGPVLERKLKPSLYQFTERFFYTLGDAPIIIFAYNQPDPEENNQTSLGSVYMAVQNLILAAESEGLGTCAMGSPLEVREDVDRLLGLEGSELQLVCGLTVGYPDHQPPAAPRQAGRVHWLGFSD